MSTRYPREATDLCRDLYVKYNGGNYDAIEREMRKAGWANWTKKNLEDRGDRMGWISKFGYERALKESLKMSSTAVLSDEQSLYQGIKTAREKLQSKVNWADEEVGPTRDELYQYRDFCKLEIEARRNLDLSRDNLETFVAGYEKLVIWLGEIDPAAAKMLVKRGDRLVEMAELHYGKPEENGDGAGPREDEGGEPASRGLDS